MKLQEFVNETLKEVIAGVKEAQAQARDNGAIINPATRGVYPAVKDIDFDVAVTSSDTTETQAGVGVFVAALGVGAKAKSDTSSSCISRAKFSVPICFSMQER
jgi:hypothetical protein